jgi:hypothetical protein
VDSSYRVRKRITPEGLTNESSGVMMRGDEAVSGPREKGPSQSSRQKARSGKTEEKSQKLRQDQVALGGVMVSVLPTGPKVCRFKPGQGDKFLMAIKIYNIPSFRGEVKLKAPCHKILLHVKNQMCYTKMSYRSLYTCYH